MPDFNPLISSVTNIELGAFSIYQIKNNAICRFEKLEMVESVFDLFPSGAVIVRDVSDVIKYIKDNEIETITITTADGENQTYFITGTTYVTNAASETEENFVSINFSNFLFKENQNKTVVEILENTTPTVYEIDDLIESLADGLNQFENPNLEIDSGFTNFVLHKPINPLEEKADILSDNPIQYINYITSLACKNGLPRYLCWTGFENTVYVKYFESSVTSTNFKRYAVYSADTPSAKIGGQSYKKIYLLTTAPADQYLNRVYYYIRKTPKILNKQSGTSISDITKRLFNHQYLDDGLKYDIEIITEDGVVDTFPSLSGISLIEYKNHYGYYTKNDSNNNFSSSSLLSLEYGNRNIYSEKSFYIPNPYPFIDNPEMWKNIWDLTPIHPNLSGGGGAAGSKLQTILTIRKNTQTDTVKLDQIYNIELQNFIYYVLCCLTPPEVQEQIEEQEETFFACITGWRVDPEKENSPYKGKGEEPLIYRYSWNRLAVNIDENDLTNFDYFSNPENGNIWYYDDEKSSSVNDDPNLITWAINLNERKNSYYSTSATNSYYAPGWYTKNLTEQIFNAIRYKPIGNRGDTVTTSTQTEMCYAIVQMRKIPYFKILREAKNYADVINTQELYDELKQAAVGKYVYCFEMANITDGPCTIQQQGGGQ